MTFKQQSNSNGSTQWNVRCLTQQENCCFISLQSMHPEINAQLVSEVSENLIN